MPAKENFNIFKSCWQTRDFLNVNKKKYLLALLEHNDILYVFAAIIHQINEIKKIAI